MERLTKPDSDYCHDICGSVNGCPRIMDGKKRCRGYDLYENMWPSICSIAIDFSILSAAEARDIFDVLRNNERLYLAELGEQELTPNMSDDETREALQKFLLRQ